MAHVVELVDTQVLGTCASQRGGSSPSMGTNQQSRGISSAGRAPDLHSGGQRFDPAILHHFYIRSVL